MEQPHDSSPEGAGRRGGVSVIVPFAGTMAEAAAVMKRLAELELGPGDEAILVDNGGAGAETVPSAAEGVPPAQMCVVRARREHSSYYARNAGAAVAGGEWLLFLDADCHPPADLIDRYFSSPIPDRVGAVAGGIEGLPSQESLISRYARARRHLDQELNWSSSARPWGVTANLLVRRQAWASVGGFAEGIRSGGDADFCWRLQDAGWELGLRSGATVWHEHRQTLPSLLRQAARYGGGRAWLRRRHPDGHPHPVNLRWLARLLVEAVTRAARGDREGAAFSGLDILYVSAEWLSFLLGSNRAGAGERGAGGQEADGRDGRPLRLTVLVDQFPALSETFVIAEIARLAELGHEVAVEAGAAAEQAAAEHPVVPVHLLTEAGWLSQLLDLFWLATCHPGGCMRDLRSRARWRREEWARPLRVLAPVARRIHQRGSEHLHAHFAAAAALDAMRLADILGLTYSVTAHAYDIYQHPRNLAEKLSRASFATGVSEYSVADLRRMAGPGASIQLVKMGVDHERFHRRRPLPGGRTVLTVARLIEKKGIGHLLEATARLRETGTIERLIIIGEGPLGPALRARADTLGLDGVVEWWGAQHSSAVRQALEEADLVAIPAVPAAGGDRDVLPLIAGEALAMELPVVASDFVGLPEVVQPPWGRLVPPGDVEALADAIAGMLDLDPDLRAAAGRAGREFAVRTRDQRREAERLAELIRAARARSTR